MEEGSRHPGGGNGAGGPAEFAYQARLSTGCEQWGAPTPYGAVFPGTPPASDDTRAISRSASLVIAGGPAAERGDRPGLRRRLSEAQEPRGVRQGRGTQYLPSARAVTTREGLVDVHDGNQSSREASPGGDQGDAKGTVYQLRQRRRLREQLWRRQERKAEGGRQKRQDRLQRAEKRKRGGERKGGLRLCGERKRGHWRRPEKERLRKEGELDVFPKGVLGGIDSRGCTEAPRLNGPENQVVSTDACGSGACLPEGGSKPLIKTFETFEEVMGWAWDALKKIRSRMRRHLTMAEDCQVTHVNKEDIFPLPVSQAAPLSLRCTVSALNDLSGYSPDVAEPDLSASMDVQKNLIRLIERFEIWDCPCPDVSFKKLFSTKTLDYSGEEVKIAQRLNWSAVSQSLPDGVGRLPLEAFCRLGTLHYVQHFTDHLLPNDAIKVPRPPAVMVEPGEWSRVCKGLVEKNICEIWPVELLFHWEGVPLLNGLFAVGKGEYVGSVETQRLIMNLTPVNSLCQSLREMCVHSRAWLTSQGSYWRTTRLPF